jgi:RsiW-degrading membrane proteinase PrsW (M82 family)
VATVLLLYGTLAICAVVIGVVVIRYDLYDREPLRIILLAAALGAIAMWLTGLFQLAVLNLIHTNGATISNTSLAVLAGTSEELAKFAVVLAVAGLSRRNFNEPLDGLTYGSFAGLGCALYESVVLLVRVGDSPVLPLQEPIRLAGHLVMGGIAGSGLGLLTMPARSPWLSIVGGITGAMLLHTLWDIAAFDAADHQRHFGRILPWHTGAPIVLMIAGMIAYRLLVERGLRLSRISLGVCDLKSHRCPPF